MHIYQYGVNLRCMTFHTSLYVLTTRNDIRRENYFIVPQSNTFLLFVVREALYFFTSILFIFYLFLYFL